MSRTTLASLAVSLALSLPACTPEQVRDSRFSREDIRHYGVGTQFGLHYELIAHNKNTSRSIGVVIPELSLRAMDVYHPGTAIVREEPKSGLYVPIYITQTGLFYRSRKEVPLGYLTAPWGDLRLTTLEIPPAVREFFLEESYYRK